MIIFSSCLIVSPNSITRRLLHFSSLTTSESKKSRSSRPIIWSTEVPNRSWSPHLHTYNVPSYPSYKWSNQADSESFLAQFFCFPEKWSDYLSQNIASGDSTEVIAKYFSWRDSYFFFWCHSYVNSTTTTTSTDFLSSVSPKTPFIASELPKF